MGTTDISIEELGRAFSEAKAALADDAALNWTRNSALTERAYLFGNRPANPSSVSLRAQG
jgi:hypothetical protein